MFKANFDGACDPNPGKGSYGFVIYDPKGKILKEEFGRMCGKCTNNVAEYMALICLMITCHTMNLESVLVEGDSLLVINQVTGKYKVKNVNLAPLYETVKYLVGQNQTVFTFKHVKREFNTHADMLSKKGFIQVV